MTAYVHNGGLGLRNDPATFKFGYVQKQTCMYYMEKEISTHYFITNYCILSHLSCRTLLISASAHTSLNTACQQSNGFLLLRNMSQECMEFQ